MSAAETVRPEDPATVSARDPSGSFLLSIVVPVYNESGNIEELARRIREALPPSWSWEAILVNDGSTDGSAAELDAAAAADARIRVVHLRRNFGQTAAMMAGLDAARGEILVAMDADLQNDPLDIPLLVTELEKGYDVCSGWRRDRRDAALTRILPSRIANRLISAISGVRLKDYGCTLKAYRRDVIRDVKLYGEMHRFIPIYASWQGARVTEIPVRHHPRLRGRSKYGLERTLKVILDLIVVKFLTDYSQKPIYVFGGFGLASMAASILCFGLMVYYKFWGGKTFIETPLPELVVLLFVVGFMSILMGLLAELMVRTYYESQRKSIYQIERTVNMD
ncbi:MAG: glycosyltransferase family 2 protein [Lentisphaeria bacterium]|nr:glycosyltransferase family 2 protein [Lentisphaeria bacterium]